MRVADFDVIWIDAAREPTQPPDPAYPDGIDIDLTRGRLSYCETTLAHPTPRCGQYYVYCRRCGVRVMLTTAGRPDDPRSVKIACKID